MHLILPSGVIELTDCTHYSIYAERMKPGAQVQGSLTTEQLELKNFRQFCELVRFQWKQRKTASDTADDVIALDNESLDGGFPLCDGDTTSLYQASKQHCDTRSSSVRWRSRDRNSVIGKCCEDDVPATLDPVLHCTRM